jgi:hypothetical protein
MLACYFLKNYCCYKNLGLYPEIIYVKRLEAHYPGSVILTHKHEP